MKKKIKPIHLIILSILLLIIIFLIFFLSNKNFLNNFIDKESRDMHFTYPVTSQQMIENESAYPIINDPIESNWVLGPEFTINLPVMGGDVNVSGEGPANIPISLVNVSEGGLIIGETQISDKGLFIFYLDDPIASNQTIGIQLGDISNTNINPNDFIYSPTYYDRPFIGILFDLVHVE